MPLARFQHNSMVISMGDLGTPENPFAREYLELRLLQLSTQIKAKEIRIKELQRQIGVEQQAMSELISEKDEVEAELKTGGNKNG